MSTHPPNKNKTLIQRIALARSRCGPSTDFMLWFGGLVAPSHQATQPPYTNKQNNNMNDNVCVEGVENLVCRRRGFLWFGGLEAWWTDGLVTPRNQTNTNEEPLGHQASRPPRPLMSVFRSVVGQIWSNACVCCFLLCGGGGSENTKHKINLLCCR